MFVVMVIEDDPVTRRLTCQVLHRSGYEPIPAGDGSEALELMDKHHVDLFLVDIMMPNMDGFEFIRTIRGSRFETPILMTTAKETLSDKRLAFQAGADDYMVKPIDEEELLLRISALLRRAKIASERKLTAGSTVLDYDSLSVRTPAGEQILPQKEFLVLFRMLSYPGRIFTRRQLMDELWGMESDTDERTVDVHVNRLRDRFRGNRDFEITTIRGLGYRATPTGEEKK